MEVLKPKKTILLLDKDNRILSVVDDMMYPGNFDIHIIFDPNSIYHKAKDLKPDLVILDYLLLNNACAQICHDFKEDNELRSTPLIVATAYKSKKTREEAYKCDALFLKPLDISLFASTMEYLTAS